jgi:hypothetical protein
MPVQSNVEAMSLLPKFSVKRSEDFKGWLIVTCPRDDCGGMFVVERKAFYAKRTVRDTLIVGRPCPYCFKAGRLPASREIR